MKKQRDTGVIFGAMKGEPMRYLGSIISMVISADIILASPLVIVTHSGLYYR